MTGLESPDWRAIFVPDGSLAGSFVRGTLVYFVVLLLFRTGLRRQGGALGMSDLMLAVLVSECVSSGLTAEANSIPNATVSVFAVLFWSYSLDRLSYYWPWLQRLLEPRPLALIENGKLNRPNLESEGITDEELASQLRVQGVEDPAKVKQATLEPQGSISVITKQEESHSPEAEDTSLDLDHALKQFLLAATNLEVALKWHNEHGNQRPSSRYRAEELLSRYGLKPRNGNGSKKSRRK